MNLNDCYIKTDIGRLELRTRMLGLSSRLRALLVMIDGQQQVADYLKKLAGTGMTAEAFVELRAMGLIEPVSPADIPAATTTAPIVQATLGRYTDAVQSTLQQDTEDNSEELSTEEEEGEAMSEDPSFMLKHQRLHQIHEFYNNTIRDHIGLRGFMLQVDVEHASTLEDYRALRERYITALNKSSAPAVAQVLIEQLDRLLDL